MIRLVGFISPKEFNSGKTNQMRIKHWVVIDWFIQILQILIDIELLSVHIGIGVYIKYKNPAESVSKNRT